MSMLIRTAIFASAALVASANRHADSAKYDVQDGFEARLSGFMKTSRSLKSQMICGSTKIKQALNSGADNVPWTSIMELADNYIAQQTAGLQAKEAEIQTAQAALIRALETESVPEISSSEEKLEELFEPVFKTYDEVIDNGKQYMIDSNCGSARIVVNGKRKQFVKAYDLSTDAFRKSLAKSSRQFTMQLSEVTKATCLAILQKPKDSADGQCKLFCDEVAHIGREVTSAASVAKGDSAGLQAKLQLLRTEVEGMMALREDCQSSKQELLAFESELGGITAVITQSRRKLTSFNQEADETRFDLEDLSEEAEKQRLLIVRLLEVLKSASLEQNGLETKVSNLQNEYAELSEALEVTSSLLAHTMQEVEKATLASNTVQDLQARLTAVLLQINVIFDQSVRSPISKMGFGPAVSIRDFFPTDVNPPEVQAAMGNFNAFCREPATQTSFQLADKAVQLAGDAFGSMCHLPEGVTDAEVASSVSDIIQRRVGKLVELLQSVQSWTDPFKGTQRNTLEIEGLRNVIAIFGNSDHSKDPFFEYLRKWKKGSRFPKLVAKLASALASERNAAGELQRNADSLQATISELHASLDRMQSDLENAIVAARAAGRDVAEAETVQRTLDEQQAAMQAKLAEFEANAREAREALEQARAELVNTHTGAISLMEKFNNVELEGELKQVSHH